MHELAALRSTADVLSPAPAVSRADRDLTDPAQGLHAVQHALRRASDALASFTGCRPHVDRGPLPLPAAGAVLARALEGQTGALLLRPRRVDGGRTPPRHELEACWVRRGDRIGLRELGRCLWDLAAATARGLTASAVPGAAAHVLDGRKLDVRVRGSWQTIATCGVAPADLLRRWGLPDDATALVLTVDLDRLVLLAKGIDDPALLTARDPGIAAQMRDLEPYIPPALRRRSRRDPSARSKQALGATLLGATILIECDAVSIANPIAR